MIRLKLKEYLDKNEITRYRLEQLTGIRYSVITKYYHNIVMRYDSDILNRICNALNCKISDIIEYIPDKK